MLLLIPTNLSWQIVFFFGELDTCTIRKNRDMVPVSSRESLSSQYEQFVVSHVALSDWFLVIGIHEKGIGCLYKQKRK